MPRNLNHQEQFDRDNQQAAKIIMTNPTRYAACLEWARLWLAEHEPQRSLFTEQDPNEKETYNSD